MGRSSTMKENEMFMTVKRIQNQNGF